MFATKFKYEIDTTNSTIKVGITPSSLLKLTLQTTFWALAPTVLFVAGCAALDAKDQKKSNTEDHLPEN